MGASEVQRSYGTFCCVECGETFAGDIPAIFVDLPLCPCCHAPSQIDRILQFHSWEEGCWEG